MPIDTKKLDGELASLKLVIRDSSSYLSGSRSGWLGLDISTSPAMQLIERTRQSIKEGGKAKDALSQLLDGLLTQLPPSADRGKNKPSARAIAGVLQKILKSSTIPEHETREGVTSGGTDSAPPTPPVATPVATPPRTPTIATPAGSAGRFGEDRSTLWLREMEKEKEQMESCRKQKTALDQRVDAAISSVEALKSRVQKAIEDRLSRVQKAIEGEPSMESIYKAKSHVLGIQSRASWMVADESPSLRSTLNSLRYLLPQFEEQLVSFEKLIEHSHKTLADYEEKTRQMPTTEERRAQYKKQAHEAIEAFRAQIITPFLGEPPSELHAKNVSRILSPWVAKCAEIQKLLASDRFDEVQQQSQELTKWVTEHSSKTRGLTLSRRTPDHSPAFTAYSRDISRIGAGDIGMRTLDTSDFSTISDQRKAVDKIIKAISEPEGPPATRSSHRPR